MTHYAGDTKAQKRYLYECGYSYKFLNKLNNKEIYYLYRKHESEKINDIFGY